MLDILYPIGFSVALISLMSWQFAEGKRLEGFFRMIFTLAIIAYMVGLFVDQANFESKAFHIVRDFFILGIASIIARASKENAIIAFATFVFSIFAAYFSFTNFNEERINLKPQSHNHAEDIINEKGIQFLVEMFPTASRKEINEFASSYGMNISSAFNPQEPEMTDLDDYLILSIPKQFAPDLQNIREQLQNIKGVEWTEDNEFIATPILKKTKAQRVNKKYGINDPNVEMQWGMDKMQIDLLYKFLQTNEISSKKKALIAILDTGVDSKHEDLKNNYKSIDKKSDSDGNRHGTHCAGIAAAVTNNNLGIASMIPNDKFVEVGSVKVLKAFGGGTQAGIISGIIKAADKGADVISMSLGGKSNDARQKAYKEAVDYANKKGAIVVVAAGNSNANAAQYAPANTPGVITVAAVDQELSKAKFSNFINDIEMGICAPGVDIYSTIPDDKYAAFSGTSMATPQVAGLLGLMKSIKPKLSTKEAYQIISNSGLKVKDRKETGNFIQPAKAIEQLIMGI